MTRSDRFRFNPVFRLAVASVLAFTAISLSVAESASAGLIHEKKWTLGEADPSSSFEVVAAKAGGGVVGATVMGTIYESREGKLRRLVSSPAGTWVDDMDVAPDGSIFLLTDDGITRYSSVGKQLSRWGGKYFGSFEDSQSVAVAPDGTVLVTSSDRGEIRRFGPDGEFLGRWGGAGKPPIGKPRDVAADSDGNFYVADSKAQKIRVLNDQGLTIRVFGKRGWGPGRIDWIDRIAVDGEGHVYISEQSLNRIQVFSRDGEPLGQIGRSGVAGDYNFFWLANLAGRPGGGLLVADSNRNLRSYRYEDGPFRRYAGIAAWTLDWNRFVRPGRTARIPFVVVNFATAPARGVTYCMPRSEFRAGFILGQKRCRSIGAIPADGSKRFSVRVRAPLPGSRDYLPCCSLDFQMNLKSTNAGWSEALSQIFLKVKRKRR